MPLDYLEPYPVRPRLRDRSSYVGERGYFITTATQDRHAAFLHAQIVMKCVGEMRQVAQEFDFDILAYCFMPDHLHIVLNGKSQVAELQKFVKTYKQKTGYYYKQHFGQRLWSHSYYDRVLRKEQNIKTVCKYTFMNPVEAGLVKTPKEYLHMGSFVYDMDEILLWEETQT